MALGNITKNTTVFTDTNNSGQYIAASTSIVGEIQRITVSKPRSSVRQLESGKLTPTQSVTFTFYANIWNTTTLQFDRRTVSIAIEADSAVPSTTVDNDITELSTLITAAIITNCRNGLR